MRRRLLLCLALTACAAPSVGPTTPRTLEEARATFQRRVDELAFAQQDLWALGGRDHAVFVHLDTTRAPSWFVLRRGQGAP